MEIDQHNGNEESQFPLLECLDTTCARDSEENVTINGPTVVVHSVDPNNTPPYVGEVGPTNETSVLKGLSTASIPTPYLDNISSAWGRDVD